MHSAGSEAQEEQRVEDGDFAGHCYARRNDEEPSWYEDSCWRRHEYEDLNSGARCAEGRRARHHSCLEGEVKA